MYLCVGACVLYYTNISITFLTKLSGSLLNTLKTTRSTVGSTAGQTPTADYIKVLNKNYHVLWSWYSGRLDE